MDVYLEKWVRQKEKQLYLNKILLYRHDHTKIYIYTEIYTMQQINILNVYIYIHFICNICKHILWLYLTFLQIYVNF